jgi:predicted ribonuclease YlaK
MARTYVLDTNVPDRRPGGPGSLPGARRRHPLTVVEELDKLKTRPDETGASARRAIRTLERLRQQGNLSEGVELPGGGRIWVEVSLASRLDLPEALSSDSSDNRILATTANLAKELAGEREVVLVSKDASLRIKAEALKLLAEEYRHERVAIEEGYLGVAVCEQAAGIDAIYAARGGEITADQPLWANQFVVLRSGSQSALGQVRRTVEAGEPVEVALVGEPPRPSGCGAAPRSSSSPCTCCTTPRCRWCRWPATPGPARPTWPWPPGWSRPWSRATTTGCWCSARWSRSGARTSASCPATSTRRSPRG